MSASDPKMVEPVAWRQLLHSDYGDSYMFASHEDYLDPSKPAEALVPASALEAAERERDVYADILLTVSHHLELPRGESGPCDDYRRYETALEDMDTLYRRTEAERVAHSEKWFQAEAACERARLALEASEAREHNAHIAVAEERKLADAAEARIAALEAENGALQKVLVKINAIRNSIIGFQKVGWSEHIYPLVAALHEAGFNGEGYEVARKEAQTLLDRVNAAEAALELAAEDERDRLYRKANADYIEAEDRGDAIAQEWHSAAAGWLGHNGGKSEDDRAIARAALRQAEEKSDG